ncbi:MAG TPA: hypothetical protein ENK11_06540 [Phycisphaerales bacterium]|nr:hypothetical protein [Phycisphaerales bacterium]
MLETLFILPEPESQTPRSTVRFPLRLRRAWPRETTRLGLQYTDADGRAVPGQWFADRNEAIGFYEKLGRATNRAAMARAGAHTVVLQPGGADTKLPALESLLREPGAELTTHRPGRRAVVRFDDAGGTLYAKALRPSKIGRIIRANQFVSGLDGRAFGVAPIRSTDESIGMLVLRRLPGRNLHDLADPHAFVEGCAAAGRALRTLHVAPPDGFPLHDDDAEARMLRDRVEGIGVFVPALHGAASDACERVCKDLTAAAGRRAVLHRDFYDKQIVIDTDGTPGFLDFDTLGVGEPELDLANMLGHIELRVLQGECSPETAREAATAFLDAYGPANTDRIGAYLDSTRLRLAMLYAYRPKWARLAPMLLDKIGDRPTSEAPRVCVVAATKGNTSGRGRIKANNPPCPLVFVVGCPRSGTTMLERMLDAHRDIAMAHETHWVTKHTKRGRDLTSRGHLRPETLDALYADHRFARMAPPREQIEEMMARRPLKYRRFVRTVYDHYRRSRGKAYAGDKSTGGYIRDLGRLHRVCPDSKIVHLVRDGRDVCLSMLNWPKSARAAGRYAMFKDDPVATVACWWQWHVRAAMRQGRPLGEDLYTEVRYERLVREPERECAALCAFLGLEPDDAMARFHAGRSKPGGRSANAAWLPPTPGLRNWRIQMTDEQIEMFEAIAGETLESLGYARCMSKIAPSTAALAAERVEQWKREIGDRASAPARRVSDVTSEIPILEGEHT